MGTEEGRIVDDERLAVYRRHVPDLRVVVMEGAGHDLFRIDRNTLQAYNLGVYGASGATGLAFNTAGLLVSSAPYHAAPRDVAVSMRARCA